MRVHPKTNRSGLISPSLLDFLQGPLNPTRLMHRAQTSPVPSACSHGAQQGTRGSVPQPNLHGAAQHPQGQL